MSAAISQLASMRDGWRAEIEQLKLRVEAVDKLVALFHRETPAVAVVQELKGPKGRKAKTPPLRPAPSVAPGKMMARRALYVAAIAKCGETFSAEELIERGGLQFTAKVVSGNLNWWTKKGLLAKADKGSSALAGTWRRSLGWRAFAGSVCPGDGGTPVSPSERKDASERSLHRPTRGVSKGIRQSAGPCDQGKLSPRKKEVSAPAPQPAPPQESAEPKGSGFRLSRTAGTRQSPQATALESLFAGLSGSYPAVSIIEMVRKSWPDLVATAAKETDLRVRLIDMASAGKIRRIGVGAGAHYSAVPGRQPAAAAGDDLKISVPRDADAGGGEE